MTEEAEDIPKLEGSDHEEDESASMADDEFCQCPGSKTKGIVKKNKNKCPEANCGKKLTDIPGYDSDTEQKEPSRSEQSLKILTEWLDGLSSGHLKGAKTKDQNQSSVRIKPPSFKGSEDPAHFFVKLNNFVEINKIKKEEEKSAILKSCLSDEALDLFLSLPADEQADIQALEKIFKQHFKPVKRALIETERFLRTKKEKGQSVSTFYAKIKKQGLDLLMDPVLIRQAFCQ